MRTARRFRAVQAGPVLRDSFTRADSTTVLGPAETAHAYTVAGGVFGIASNKAYVVSNSGNDTFAHAELGRSDVTVSADLTMSSVRASVGFALRLASNTQYLIVRCKVPGSGAQNLIELIKYNSGYTTLATKTSAGLSLGGTATLAVVMAGTSIEVFKDGVSQITYNTSTGYEAHTKHGFYMYTGAQDDDHGSRWDNLVMSV